MARPLRIEFPGALYHVTARGDRQEAIFLDDHDRAGFLALLGETCERFDLAVHAWCLMGNHYHVVLTTRSANLSQAMRHLNGVYTLAGVNYLGRSTTTILAGGGGRSCR
jgi:putative transposase